MEDLSTSMNMLSVLHRLLVKEMMRGGTDIFWDSCPPFFVIPLPKQSKKTSTLVIATNADMYISTPVAVQGHDGMFPEGGFGCF